MFVATEKLARDAQAFFCGRRGEVNSQLGANSDMAAMGKGIGMGNGMGWDQECACVTALEE